MPDDYRISDLSTAPSIGNSDLMELSVVNTASDTGYTSMKAPVLNLANKIVNATQYVSDLQTQNKTITGAINEIAQGGGGGGGDADIVKTASGNPCSFSTSFAGELKSLTADIVCGGGGGTPTTPNPIVGHSELNLTRCGANFTDISDNTTSGAGYIIGGFPVAINADNVVLPSGIYVFSFAIQNATYPCACQLIWYRNGVEVGNTVATINSSGINSIAFTASGEFDSFVMFCNSSSGGAFTNFNLNIGSTATAYEPYNGETFTVSFGQTVYGGVYDKTGRLTITWGAVDLGTLDWIYTSGDHSRFETTTALPNVKVVAGNIIPNALCSIYKMESMNNVYLHSEDNIIGFDNYVWAYDSSAGTDANAFKTAVTGQMLAYELANPIIIDVPSISVFAENGTNNIVSDCGGDVSAEYYTDLAEDIKDFIGDGVEVGDLANVEITTPSNNQVLKYDATSQKWVNGTGGGGASWVDITGTLLAGNTFVSWGSHPDIHANSTVDIYVDTAFYGVAPLTVVLSEGSLSLTFEAQSADMPVKVRLS